MGICCNGACEPNAAILEDNQNCGTCGAVCPSGLYCSNGGCVPSNCGSANPCPTGYALGNLCACYPVACASGASGDSCLIDGDAQTSGTCCDGACLDLGYDHDNCGACGNVCPGGEYCYAGACRTTVACTGLNQGELCAAPSGAWGECCGTTCADILTDSANCDGCGRICPMGTTCSGSLCVVADGSTASCVPDTGNPTANCPPGTACVDDTFACAETTCTAAGVVACQNGGGPTGDALGVCCAAGDGGCPDTTSDPDNCGACGVVCASGACNQGVCVPSPSDAGCAALGGCPAGTVCAAGLCVGPASACPVEPGPQYCDEGDGGAAVSVCCGHEGVSPECANLLTDRKNCGVCFHACEAGHTCAAGKCQ
jgi:hypothetical protein